MGVSADLRVPLGRAASPAWIEAVKRGAETDSF